EVDINLGAGNDQLFGQNSTDWEGSISGGPGDDLVDLTNTSFTGDVAIDLSDGNDTLTVTNSEIGGVLAVDMGAGNDAVTLDASVVFPFINLGVGNDQFVATGNTIGDGVFDGGDGDDVMLFSQNRFATLGNFQTDIALGSGNDQLVAAGNTFASGIDFLNVEMGDGDDYFVSGGNIFSTDTYVDANGGAGYDLLVALDSQPPDQFIVPPILTNWELIDPDFPA
ncbi:MAG: hypothetical protein ACF8TS_07210, partial [Maioricimonas sp. JB049]